MTVPLKLNCRDANVYYTEFFFIETQYLLRNKTKFKQDSVFISKKMFLSG